MWLQRRRHRKAGHVIKAYIDQSFGTHWECLCGQEWSKPMAEHQHDFDDDGYCTCGLASSTACNGCGHMPRCHGDASPTQYPTCRAIGRELYEVCGCTRPKGQLHAQPPAPTKTHFHHEWPMYTEQIAAKVRDTLEKKRTEGNREQLIADRSEGEPWKA